MVGTTTWRAGEVVWILKEWRTGRNLDELVEKFRFQFPQVERPSLHKSITYVWQKYSKDPSYNHQFTSAEIAVIMEQHFAHRVDLERLVEKFQEDFPKHDWKQHVDKRTAIDCIIGKFGWDHSTRCISWEINEIRFILRNKLKLKSWQRLFEEFQAWKKRRDLTTESLQYLCVTHGFYHLDTNEGLENHYRVSLNGPDKEIFTDSGVFYKAPGSKISHENSTDLTLVKSDSRTKRKREFDSSTKEVQAKRAHYLPSQPWSHKEDEEIATEAHNTSPSTYRNLKTNVSNLVVGRKSLGYLTGPLDMPHSQLKRTRVENKERIKAKLSNGHGHAQFPASNPSAVQVHPLQASKSQLLSARHHLPRFMAQNNSNCDLVGQYHFTPPHIGKLGIELSLSDQPLKSSSYPPYVSQNNHTEWSPRITSTTNISKDHSHQIGHLSQNTEIDSPLRWQNRQLDYTNGCLAGPTKRSKNQYDPGTEHRPNQNHLIPMGHHFSDMDVEGKMALPGDDLQPIFTDHASSRNLAAQASVRPNEFPISCGRENASIFYPGTYGLIGPAVSDTRATSWIPSSTAPRDVYAGFGRIYDPTLHPSPNHGLTRAPNQHWEDLLDPALFGESSSGSFQSQVEEDHLQYSISTPAQDADIQPRNLHRRSNDMNFFTAPSFEDNQHLGLNLRSLPTAAIAMPSVTTDEFYFLGSDKFVRSFSCPMPKNVPGWEVLPKANPHVSTRPGNCEAYKFDGHNISGQLEFIKPEIFQDLGTASAFDPASSTGSKEQEQSYLNQEGSSFEQPIIIQDEDFDTSLPPMQEWDIYSATPLHALFPSGREETPIFESDLAGLPILDHPTGEHDIPDILQEVAALGEIPLSEDISQYLAGRENREVDEGYSTKVPTYGVDI